MVRRPAPRSALILRSILLLGTEPVADRRERRTLARNASSGRLLGRVSPTEPCGGLGERRDVVETWGALQQRCRDR